MCAILFLKSSGWKNVITVNFRLNQLQMTCSRIHRSIIPRAIYSIRWIHLRICQPELDSVRFKSNLIPTWPHFWNLIDNSTFTCENIYSNSVEFWLQTREQNCKNWNFNLRENIFTFLSSVLLRPINIKYIFKSIRDFFSILLFLS